MLCEETDTQGAVILAERIREVVADTVYSTELGKLSVKCSIGVATFPDDAKSPEELFKVTDQPCDLVDDLVVKILGQHVDRINFPYFLIFCARFPQWFDMFGAKGDDTNIAVLHGYIQRTAHSPLRSRATLGSRNSASIWLPSSKLSSIMNLSFAAFFIFTRFATSR